MEDVEEFGRFGPFRGFAMVLGFRKVLEGVEFTTTACKPAAGLMIRAQVLETKWGSESP